MFHHSHAGGANRDDANDRVLWDHGCVYVNACHRPHPFSLANADDAHLYDCVDEHVQAPHGDEYDCVFP